MPWLINNADNTPTAILAIYNAGATAKILADNNTIAI